MATQKECNCDLIADYMYVSMEEVKEPKATKVGAMYPASSLAFFMYQL